MPAPPPDFHDVMNDLVKFQFEIGKIHAQLTNPRQKEVLGEALARVEQARNDAITAYPKAMQTIRETAAQSKKEALECAAKLDALKARLATMQGQAGQIGAAGAAAAGAAGALAANMPERPKFNGQRGQRLGDELLSRVTSVKPAADATMREDKEIWQDWDKS